MANTTKKYVSLDKLSLYNEKINKVISDADAAALASAKQYTDNSIALLDPAGSAATAEANAKTYTDGKIETVNTTIAGVKTTAEQGVADAATAQAAADKAQGDVDGLKTYVGTIPTGATATNIVGYVQEKTSGIASQGAMTELSNRVTTVEGKVSTIEGDYLKGSDKTTLEGAIALKADQTALDEVAAVANAAVKKSDYDVKVKALEDEDARIEGLVTAEAERAANAESGLEGRIETMEAFWAAAQADGTESNVIDTLKEIQDYIAGDETGAANMLAAIEANEKAIEDMDAAYKAADATLQGNIDKKADASAVEAIDGRVGALETASATHATKTELQAVSDTLTEYKDARADDYTNAQIDAAIKVVADDVAALNDIYATDDELAAAIEGAKTDASNKDAVVLAEAQKGITAVQTAIDTHTGNADIHVTAGDKTKWNAALQASDIVSGSANGTISVKGADVAVKGLGSAAYAATTAFDASGSAAQALVDAKAYTDTAFGSFVECSEEEINALFTA